MLDGLEAGQLVVALQSIQGGYKSVTLLEDNNLTWSMMRYLPNNFFVLKLLQ